MMTVGLNVDFLWYPLGDEDFVHCFFSTICHNLENLEWGSRFPCLMNGLYQGKLSYANADMARQELLVARKELEAFAPSKVVWDIEDLSKQPPWGDNISPDITSLSNYFVTSNGDDLFSVMIEVFDTSQAERQDILLKRI